MNYVYLARKYAGVDCLCNDRSFDGLIWPRDAGPKPSPITFEGWQAKEEELARQAGYHQSVVSRELSQKAEAARAKALADIVPYEDKVRGVELEAYEKAHKLHREAIECQSALRVGKELEKAWSEISKAQDIINKEAQAYLEETAFVLVWDHTDVPAEIAEKRAEAQKRIQLGKTVYADWRSLRSNLMPSQQEIHEAIQKGGEHLERIRETARQAALKYPAPRIHS